jgi:hypothetical protein
MPERLALDLASALTAKYGVPVPVVATPLDNACVVAPPPTFPGRIM